MNKDKDKDILYPRLISNAFLAFRERDYVRSLTLQWLHKEGKYSIPLAQWPEDIQARVIPGLVAWDSDKNIGIVEDFTMTVTGSYFWVGYTNE